ncbi:hypothetical protein V5799_020153, partial [Amblyomma americanum]
MSPSAVVLFAVFALLCAARSFGHLYQDEALTEDDRGENGVKLWALLVAGSSGYENYRHQADVCHAYHVLRNHGIPDNRIVVMMYDDIAYARNNPTPGVIVNHVNGSNLYPGVVKDYTGNLVTPSNFLDVLQGRRPPGGGTGKVIASGPRDHVFVYFSDHGAPGMIAFPSDVLYARNLSNVITSMHENGQFGKMVIYLEACESGSMFDGGLLPDNVSVYATTAANPYESSYACYWDPVREAYLGDVYSVNWLEDSDKENLRWETLIDQFKIVRAETNTSHVMEYGDLSIGAMTVSQFQGRKEAEPIVLPSAPMDAVDSRDVPVAILENKIEAATDLDTKRVLLGELKNVLNNRVFVQEKVREMALLLRYGSTEEANILLTVKQPLTDFDCYEEAVENFSKKCFALSENPYALSHLQFFVNACKEFDVGHARLMFREEVGVQDAVVAVALMEVSMQSSALVENVDALHTGFAKDPEEEYRNQ